MGKLTYFNCGIGMKERSFKLDSKTKVKDSFKGFTKSVFSRHEGRFIKAAAAALLVTTLTYNFAFAKEETPTFDQIYHVYLGNEYMGAVDSQAKVDELVETKEQEASTQYNDLTVDAGSNIKVIPELVYKVNVDTEETLSKLDESLVILADAYQISVNGETVAYLKDANDYETVLNQIKLQYVSQEQLDELNARQLSNTELPPLTLNQTRILDISIQQEITGENTKVTPTEILSVEQAVELLTSGALEQVSYTVQKGDVLGSIASKHGLKTAELLAINPGLNENTLLKIGQTLNVTALKPLVSVQVTYEALIEESIPFETITKDDATILKGETKVVQEGAQGLKDTHYNTTYVNGQLIQQVSVGETVKKPATDKVIHKGTKVIPSRGTGKFSWPTNGGYISSKMGSRWGSYHRGIDIARPSNYTIKAADNGTVTFVGWDGTYGRKIVINHNNGYQTVYAHLSSFNVKVGQVVQTGANIGQMGSTGRSTGIHLHFEVLKNGSQVNPLSYLK